MHLKRVVTFENFSYVVVENRASNRRDLNAMFWPKWTQKYIIPQNSTIQFINIHVDINRCERSIEIGGQNSSNDVVKRRHFLVVEMYGDVTIGIDKWRYIDEKVTMQYNQKINNVWSSALKTSRYIWKLLEPSCQK